VAVHREMIEESGDLGGAERARVTAGVESDEGADPVEVGLLCAGKPSWRRRKAARTASTRVLQTYRRGPGESCGEPQEKWRQGAGGVGKGWKVGGSWRKRRRPVAGEEEATGKRRGRAQRAQRRVAALSQE
jgi:hypothetical protein